jgi:enediyne biosynthesis protein E4
VAAMLAVGWVLFAQLNMWNELGELRLAQQEIARGQLKAAQRRLTHLASGPGVLGGAADYWLGICEGMGGHPEAALQAFGRVPEGFAFDPLGAFREAKANLSRESSAPPSDVPNRPWLPVVPQGAHA